MEVADLQQPAVSRSRLSLHKQLPVVNSTLSSFYNGPPQAYVPVHTVSAGKDGGSDAAGIALSGHQVSSFTQLTSSVCSMFNVQRQQVSLILSLRFFFSKDLLSQVAESVASGPKLAHEIPFKKARTCIIM